MSAFRQTETDAPAAFILGDRSRLKTIRERKALLRRTQRKQQLISIGLVAPLFVFLLLTFVIPISTMLWQSVSDPVLGPLFPRTIAALRDWRPPALPPESAYDALIEDVRTSDANSTLAKAATRLNYDWTGFRSLLFKTSSALPEKLTQSAHGTLTAIDKRWDDVGVWAAIKRASGPLTDLNLLAAVDLGRNAEGSIVRKPANEAVFFTTLVRTFVIAAGVTLLAFLLGFPLALLLAKLSPGQANIVLFFVLLPFWTSILVRTFAWFVMLQREGILNELLMYIGAIREPMRLMFNRTAVFVALVQVFLPFMVLPLYSVMKNISPMHQLAAASLGATPFTAFRRIYLPQAMPGVRAGCLLVFIQALGVYITPAILGGADDQGVAYMIAFYVNKTIQWGMAAALSLILLTATLLLGALYMRLAGRHQLGFR